MKIFAFNSSISFALKKPSPHFHFEVRSLKKVVQKLSDSGPDFPGQVFFVEWTGKSGFADKLYNFHTREDLHLHNFEVTVLFDSKEDRDAFFGKYIRRFKRVEAAGGLVLSPENELLLIQRHGLWDLPKGKFEPKESVRNCAWREVGEECGIKTHKIRAPFDTSYHIFKRKGQWKFKPTFWFWMEAEEREHLVPQEEEGITDVRWVRLSDLQEYLPESYPLIAELIRELIYRSAE